MEIIFGALLEVLWAILQIVGEIVLQLLVEGAVELIGHGLRGPVRKEPLHPAVAVVGYVALGGIAGGLSLLVFPSLFIASKGFRLVNLVVTPLCAGLAMSQLGRLR